MRQLIRTIEYFLLMIFISSGIHASDMKTSFSLPEAQSYAMEHSWFLRNTSLDIGKAQLKV